MPCEKHGTTSDVMCKYCDAEEVEKAMSTSAPPRPLFKIANEIVTDWPMSKMYFGARPYVNAMFSLNKITDKYGAEDAKSIILYFLSNASTWRGPNARRIKAELKKMAGVK